MKTRRDVFFIKKSETTRYDVIESLSLVVRLARLFVTLASRHVGHSRVSPCHDDDVGCFVRLIVVLELAAVEVAAGPELGDFLLAHLLAGRLQGRAVELADLLEALLVALLLRVARNASEAEIGSGRLGRDGRGVGDGKRAVDHVAPIAGKRGRG